MENEWILTDDGTVPQWVKKETEKEFDVLEIVPFYGDEEEASYTIKSIYVDLSDYSDEEILNEIKPFGYESKEEVHETYKEEANRILAECIAENMTEEDRDNFSEHEVKEFMKKNYGITVDWKLE
ncbi:hypothetical protein IMZ31_22620 (plasmid) [Pontibacillus sp. ALD_SL1]|uniref:hypothetical protein n=1 Tax=Pontibacillus sp. ALD_SL1 TaxID=2777185 RepID=UPI001A96A6DC|nr:hypothetical protein [Pontibacillus sp. ALD_SL1]QST02251.1 hypothetical protein IMZ31_22620 [Pontibacillus sp. ALD_SL1]